MANLLMWTLNIGWKTLVFVCGWMLIKWFIRNGKGVFRDVLETITLAMESVCAFIRRKLITKLRKEATFRNRNSLAKSRRKGPSNDGLLFFFFKEVRT